MKKYTDNIDKGHNFRKNDINWYVEEAVKCRDLMDAMF